VYNMIYTDGKTGKAFAKRFAMPAITREKEYPLAQDNPNSRVHYLSANPNGEAQLVEVKLSQSSTARKKVFEYDFSELEIKGRGARGNTITKYPVRRVDLLESKGSTLSGIELWFDEASGRLNKDKRGKRVDKFDGNDQLLAITTSGNYKITNYDLTTRFEPEKTILVEKFRPKKVISAVYWDGESKQHFVKRFLIETTTPDKDFNFISEGIGSRLEYATTSDTPEVEIEVVKAKGKDKENETVNLEDLIDVKGWKAMGNRLSQYKVTKVKPVEEPEDSGLEDGDDDNDLVDAKTTETGKGSPSSKKKFSFAEAPENKSDPDEQPAVGEDGQASLFAPPKQQKDLLVNGKPAVAKVPRKKQEQQANLFAEKEKVKDEKSFGPGETIEFDL